MNFVRFYLAVTPAAVGTAGATVAAFGFVYSPARATLAERAAPVARACAYTLVWPVALPWACYRLINKE